MQDLLRYANYAKVAAKLKVHRATVARWAAGESVPAWAVERVEQLMGVSKAQEEPPPWWGAVEARLTAVCRVGYRSP
jgi:hypothetical protein